MSKKNAALIGGVMMIAGGLILQNLYKRGKLKGIEDFLEPLLSKGKEAKDKIEETASKIEDKVDTAKMNTAV